MSQPYPRLPLPGHVRKTAIWLYCEREMSYTDVAYRLKIGVSTVCNWVSALGLSRTKSGGQIVHRDNTMLALRRERALQLRESGKTYEEIAALLGVSRSTIFNDVIFARKTYSVVHDKYLEDREDDRDYTSTGQGKAKSRPMQTKPSKYSRHHYHKERFVRRKEALRLRESGKSYPEIGKLLGINPGTAHADVKNARKQKADSTNTVPDGGGILPGLRATVPAALNLQP